MTATLQQQVAAWCKEHGYPIPCLPNPKQEDRYDGIKECFRNVVRTNNSRKLQYCKHTEYN